MAQGLIIWMGNKLIISQTDGTLLRLRSGIWTNEINEVQPDSFIVWVSEDLALLVKSFPEMFLSVLRHLGYTIEYSFDISGFHILKAIMARFACHYPGACSATGTIDYRFQFNDIISMNWIRSYVWPAFFQCDDLPWMTFFLGSTRNNRYLRQQLSFVFEWCHSSIQHRSYRWVNARKT